MKKLFLRDQKGFTLIELLIVIAIIAILASLAIPQYMKYQQKAKLSSYAEPIARACLLDIAAYCVENPNTTITPASLANCSNTTPSTPGGNVSLAITAGSCLDTGEISGSKVEATMTQVAPNYKVVCQYTLQSVKCSIE